VSTARETDFENHHPSPSSSALVRSITKKELEMPVNVGSNEFVRTNLKPTKGHFE